MMTTVIPKDSFPSPFWTEGSLDLSKKLWSPTDSESRSADLGKKERSLGGGFRVVKTEVRDKEIPLEPDISDISGIWPSTKKGDRRVSAQIDVAGKTISFDPPKKGPIIRSVLIDVHISTTKKKRANNIQYACRLTYNRYLSKLKRGSDIRKEAKRNDMPVRRYLRHLFVNKGSKSKDASKAIKKNLLLRSISYDVLDRELSYLDSALKGNITKLKKGDIKKFDLSFKSVRKSQGIYIRKRWMKQERTSKSILVIKFPGVPGMKTVNHIPLHMSSEEGEYISKLEWCDSQLIRQPSGKYQLALSFVDSPKPGERKGIASLDPGIRSFQTVYDTQGTGYRIGDGFAKEELEPLMKTYDFLRSQIAKRVMNAKKRLARKKAARRLLAKIKNKRDDLHRKTISFLTSKYDTILIPVFESSKMVRKKVITRETPKSRSRYRLLSKKSCRHLLSLSHYRFRQRLIAKAELTGTKVIVVSEHHTSQTCSECGYRNTKLGGSETYKCPQCSSRMDRDLNAAKNILLRNAEAIELY